MATKEILRQLSSLFEAASAQASTSASTSSAPSPFPTLRIPASLETTINNYLDSFASTFSKSALEAKERERTLWRDGLLELWTSAEPRPGTETEPQAVARVSAFLTLLCQLSADVHEDDDASAIVSRSDIARVWWGAVLKRVVLGTGKEPRHEHGLTSDRTTRERKTVKSVKGKDAAIPAHLSSSTSATTTTTAAETSTLVKPLTVSREALEAATRMVVWGMSPTQDETDEDGHYVPPFFTVVRDEYEQRALALLRGVDEGYGVRNLEECLVNWGERFYVRFFEQIAPHITVTSTSHLPFLSLLLAFLSRHSDKAKGIHETPLFAAIVNFCLTTSESAPVALGVKSLVISLVQLTVLLCDYLPSIFAVYARLICWDRPDDLLADSMMEPELTETRSSSDPPDAMLLFSCLYGIFPCNFTAFLRDANGYLRGKGWKGPEQGGAAQLGFDSASVRELSKVGGKDPVVTAPELTQYVSHPQPLIGRHTLHPALLTSDAASELTDVARFGDADAAGVMALCDRFLVHDPPEFVPEALTTTRPTRGRRQTTGLTAFGADEEGVRRPRAAQVRNASASGSRSRSPTPHMPLTTHFSNFQALQSRSASLKSAPTSRSGSRARTPITDLVDHSHPVWGGVVTSSSADSSAHPSTTHSRASSIMHSPSTVHGTVASDYLDSRSRSRVRSTIVSGAHVSKLEFDIALLQSEVDFQRYLKQLHLQYMGTLHRQKVLESGAEAERQLLYRTIRTLRAQLKQTKSSLEQLRSESGVIKVNWVSHIDDLREKLKGLREAKGKWEQEGKGLRAEIEDLKDREAKLQNELETQGAEFFDLRNQVALDSEKLGRLGEYENRIAALTKAVAISDSDLANFKQQQREMDQLVAECQQSEQLREAVEAEVASLRKEVESKSDELIRLRQMKPIAPAPKLVPAMHSKEDVVKLQEELERLRVKNRDLIEQVVDLQQSGSVVGRRKHAEEGIEVR